MKTKNLNKNLIYFLLLMVSGITGFYIGIVLSHYEIVVKGVLSVANFFLDLSVVFSTQEFFN
jgi:hypothetical protein